MSDPVALTGERADKGGSFEERKLGSFSVQTTVQGGIITTTQYRGLLTITTTQATFYKSPYNSVQTTVVLSVQGYSQFDSSNAVQILSTNNSYCSNVSTRVILSLT